MTNRALAWIAFATAMSLAAIPSIVTLAGDTVLKLPPEDQRVLAEQLGKHAVGEALPSESSVTI